MGKVQTSVLKGSYVHVLYEDGHEELLSPLGEDGFWAFTNPGVPWKFVYDGAVIAEGPSWTIHDALMRLEAYNGGIYGKADECRTSLEEIRRALTSKTN